MTDLQYLAQPLPEFALGICLQLEFHTARVSTSNAAGALARLNERRVAPYPTR